MREVFVLGKLDLSLFEIGLFVEDNQTALEKWNQRYNWSEIGGRINYIEIKYSEESVEAIGYIKMAALQSI